MENAVKKLKKINLIASSIAVVVLILFLAINIFKFEGVFLGTYSNHYILLLAAAVAFGIGLVYKVPMGDVFHEVFQNLKSVATPVFILMLVGALTGTWLLSGVIPAMLYY